MDEARAKELLKAERERVEGELAKLRGEGREESAEKAPAGNFNNEGLYGDELAAGREGDLRRRPDQIDRAEERLAAGTYGLSVKSGQPIPDGRLEAEPLGRVDPRRGARRRETLVGDDADGQGPHRDLPRRLHGQTGSGRGEPARRRWRGAARVGVLSGVLPALGRARLDAARLHDAAERAGGEGAAGAGEAHAEPVPDRPIAHDVEHACDTLEKKGRAHKSERHKVKRSPNV